jgi:hypothetical protein
VYFAAAQLAGLVSAFHWSLKDNSKKRKLFGEIIVTLFERKTANIAIFWKTTAFFFRFLSQKKSLPWHCVQSREYLQ